MMMNLKMEQNFINFYTLNIYMKKNMTIIN